MKILMLGWEFPPVFSGGLGVVCKNLAHCLAEKGIEIHFALPHYIRKNLPSDQLPGNFSLLEFDKALEKIAKNITFHRFSSLISTPYITEEKFQNDMKTFYDRECFTVSPDDGSGKKRKVYDQDLFLEIEKFAAQMLAFVKEKNFDAIHAHDWITFEAGLRIQDYLQIPLILHVHATEMDRTGNNPNQEIFNREQWAFNQADKIIAVSQFTKDIIVKKYGILPEKVSVVHNAHRLNPSPHKSLPDFLDKKNKEKIILFIGRVTLQKGPDYFIQVAKRVLKKRKDVKFLIVGEGDKLPEILQEITVHRLHKNIFCLGFLDGTEKKMVYEKADVCVIPSVSEPFGLIALEAAEHGVPLILSENCGAKEVVHNSLKSDYWDTEKMAEYVLAVVQYPALQKTLSELAFRETRPLCWHDQAEKVKHIYEEMVP